jgi:hypothetical protein
MNDLRIVAEEKSALKTVGGLSGHGLPYVEDQGIGRKTVWLGIEKAATVCPAHTGIGFREIVNIGNVGVAGEF